MGDPSRCQAHLCSRAAGCKNGHRFLNTYIHLTPRYTPQPHSQPSGGYQAPHRADEDMEASRDQQLPKITQQLWDVSPSLE